MISHFIDIWVLTDLVEAHEIEKILINLKINDRCVVYGKVLIQTNFIVFIVQSLF